MTDVEYGDWLRAIRRAALLERRRARGSQSARLRGTRRAAAKWSGWRRPR